MPATIEEIYQKKTPIEHILLRPDTYVGSIMKDEQVMYVWDKTKSMIVCKPIWYVPGLYKIFDEILVNAADNKQRDPSMDTVRIEISERRVSIYNNGEGIPVKMHNKEKMYVPELIFGHLHTSSNYDDGKEKLTGGRNGYGAKLCNIFSNLFIVETCWKGKYYKQTFRNNMSVIGKYSIEETNKTDFTKITFEPDFERFGMECFDEDAISLMTKRAYDMCATVRNSQIYLNNEKLNVSDFQEYVQLYLKSGSNLVYQKISDRWEIAVTLSEDLFSQVSFVNSICTSKGGTHVTHVVDQLIQPLTEAVKKKDKNLVVKPQNIKNTLFVFVNCLIANPAFDSQTKENLTLKVSSFGSKCQPITKFVKQLIRETEIVERIMHSSRVKQNALLRKTDGAKTSRITGIPKLEDANDAGSKKSMDCTLILTEGDSAKTLAVAGLSIVGRDTYGVFPLRGKMLNVREASHKQIMENAEINAIKKILGLQHGKAYADASSLRYGHLMIMTDQDHDGSHIKGLIINFFDHFFPSLLSSKSFLKEFITPIVRATKGSQKRDFFTIPEYERFKAEITSANERGWHIKYYKGLGTSTSTDAKNYFSDLPLHVKLFDPISAEGRDLIDLAFNKRKTDLRKQWLSEHVPGDYLDHSVSTITIKNFINKELKLFSLADNVRSIPSMIDGFKPGQRKILFSCFKRDLRGEIKVAQMVGYVSEHSAYHHGEASLASTIVNMAHDFVGSNNINLLMPIGQFGSRLMGGKDSASPRYIYTSLNPLTRLLFHKDDDPVLTYLSEENLSIEPEFYVPIIPMILVNGAEGIGTGWSTGIPCYNPIDIIENIKRRLDGLEMVDMVPFYRNWNGKIVRHDTNRFICCGSAFLVPKTDQIQITELPIGTWTSNYKEYLDSCIAGGKIIKYKDNGTERTVDLLIQATVEFKTKLTASISTVNMVCFGADGHLKKYNSPLEIINEYFPIRYIYYQKRKDHRLKVLDQLMTRLKNRVRFIRKVTSNELLVMKRKKCDITNDLLVLKFTQFDGSFDYLLDMPISSLTEERIVKLEKEYAEITKEHSKLLSTEIKDLWVKDLDALSVEYIKVVEKEKNSIAKEVKTSNKRRSVAKKVPLLEQLDIYSLYHRTGSSSEISLKHIIKERMRKTFTPENSLKMKKLDNQSVKKSSMRKRTRRSSSTRSVFCGSGSNEDSDQDSPWSKYKK